VADAAIGADHSIGADMHIVINHRVGADAAARALPLLRLLAMGAPGRAILDYLDVSRAAVQIEPCA